MKKFIDIALWSTLAFLLIPSGLILASWNAIPGDPLYVVKTGLEKTLLAVTPSSVWQGSLQVKYTERRFEEAAQLLANNYANTDMNVDLASTGLTNLNNQVNETTQTIAKIQDPTQKAAVAKQYLMTLRTVSTKLSQQKQNSTGAAAYPQNTTPQYQQTQQSGTQQPTVINQTIVYQTTVVQQPTTQTGGAGTSGTTNSPTQTSAAQTSTTQQAATNTTTSSPVIETQITQTQQTVNQNIEEMQQIANEGEGNQGNGNGNSQGNGGQNNGNGGGNNGNNGEGGGNGNGNGNSGNNGQGND